VNSHAAAGRSIVKNSIATAMMILAVFLSMAWSHGAELILRDARAQVYFSPDGGATEAIAREIGAARKEVLVQAYVLSSQTILEALLNAHKKGVAVKLILDKSERGEGLTPGTVLAQAGVPVFLDNKHVLSHSNVIIIDRLTVITGSFSFTKAAEEANAEDLLIILSAEVAKEYSDAWERHKAHSDRY
jgi:phosphatidylserine/phosphatidylglycerophosphate/cardiolipin synthase-like enzyme